MFIEVALLYSCCCCISCSLKLGYLRWLNFLEEKFLGYTSCLHARGSRNSARLTIKRTLLKFQNNWFLKLEILYVTKTNSYIHTYITDIYHFQNGLKNSCNSTIFCLRAKLWLYDPFSQNIYFWGCNIFSHQVTFPLNSIFSVVTRIYKTHVFNEAFFLFATFAMITEKVYFSCFHGNHC